MSNNGLHLLLCSQNLIVSAFLFTSTFLHVLRIGSCWGIFSIRGTHGLAVQHYERKRRAIFIIEILTVVVVKVDMCHTEFPRSILINTYIAITTSKLSTLFPIVSHTPAVFSLITAPIVFHRSIEVLSTHLDHPSLLAHRDSVLACTALRL